MLVLIAHRVHGLRMDALIILGCIRTRIGIGTTSFPGDGVIGQHRDTPPITRTRDTIINTQGGELGADNDGDVLVQDADAR